MTFTDAYVFIPVVVYLAVVSVCLLVTSRCPWWIHPVAVAGWLLWVGVSGAVSVTTAASVVLGAAVFAVLLFLSRKSRFLSSVGMWTLAVAAILWPFHALPWYGAGLFLVGVVATVRVFRVYGKARVNMLAAETLDAAGLGVGGSLNKPSLDRLTRMDDVTAHATASGKTGALQVYLAPYLLVGAVLGALYATLT